MKTYNIQVLVFTGLLILLGAAFNFLIDPMGTFGTRHVARLSANKPEILNHERIFKTVNAYDAKPNAIIVGTSRANRAIDPAQVNLPNEKTYNWATNAQPYKESYERILRANADFQVSTVIMGLDFKFANAYDSIVPDDTLNTPVWKLKLKALFSLDTLILSVKTAAFNLRGKPLQMDYRPADGFCIVTPDYTKVNGGYYRLILENNRAYIHTFLRPPPRYTYALTDGSGKSPMDYLRKSFNFLYTRNIQAKIFLSPIHARQMEIAGGMGLWKEFEDWKRMVVQINLEEAKKADKQPFVIWDFSTYNPITTSPMPLSFEDTSEPTYYWETSHYKPIVGNMVISKLFDRPAASPDQPADFGIRITPENIEQHLATVRADREAYLAKNPEVTAQLNKLYDQFAPKNILKSLPAATLPASPTH